jgi:hypothetical protein
MQQEAGGRALTRTGTRAGVAALAIQGGNELRERNENLTSAEKRKLAVAKANMEAAESKADQEVDTSSADPDFVRGQQYGRGAPDGMKRGGKAKAYAKGGSISSRGDGCAQRGKTKGRFV